MPQCRKPKEHPPHRHRSQANRSASKSLSTTSSKPCINARQNVTLSMQNTQSSLTVRQVEQSTPKRKGNCGPHHAATRCKASEQWKSERRRHHSRTFQTRPLAPIGYNKWLIVKLNPVDKLLVNLSGALYMIMLSFTLVKQEYHWLFSPKPLLP